MTCFFIMFCNMKDSSFYTNLILFLLLTTIWSCQSNAGDTDEDQSATSFSVIDLEQIIKRDTLRAITVYSSTSYFIYRGQPMGFEYELLNQFADMLDVEIEIVIADDLEEMFAMLGEGKGDLIAHGLTITKTRKQFLAFTQPLMTTKQMLVQRKPEGWRKMNWRKIERQLIQEPFELDGKQVYVGRTSAFRERLLNLSDELGADIKVVNYRDKATSEQLIKMVASGDIDYTVADEHVARLNATFIPDIDASVPLSLSQQLAWAVHPASKKLLDTLNSFVAQLDNTTEYAVLYNKYFKHRKNFSRKLRSDYYAQADRGQLSPFDELIKQYADSLGWDWHLLASQIYQESRFNPNATSWAGARGLMQMMPKTAKAYGVNNPSDPELSMRGAVEYLRELDYYWRDIEDEQERIKFVLASYNVGQYHVRDAQRLAEKYDHDPNIWDGNVAHFLKQKSKPEYYNDEVVKYGYCRGSEPTRYVEDILKRSYQYASILSS